MIQTSKIDSVNCNIFFWTIKNQLYSLLNGVKDKYGKMIICFVVIAFCFEYIIGIKNIIFINPNKAESKDMPRHNFKIDRGYIISLDPQKSVDTIYQANHFINIQNVTIFKGINGTQAVYESNEFDHLLSLYTQYVMLTGRSDHMQLSTPSMLGCLLSHIYIWKKINPGETVAVFEEDAYMDKVSSERMYGLSNDIKSREWDVIILESGQIIASGAWVSVGDYAATCAIGYVKNNFPKYDYLDTTTTTTSTTDITNKTTHAKNICTWFGTRGYLITYKGAQKLLENAFPVHVQIDAFMGLLAAFNPSFKMYWTRENIVHQRLGYVTQVWDGCIKCYMPQQIIFYVFLLITSTLGAFHTIIWLRRQILVLFITFQKCIFK